MKLLVGDGISQGKDDCNGTTSARSEAAYGGLLGVGDSGNVLGLGAYGL